MEKTPEKSGTAAGEAERWLSEHGDCLYRYACFRMRNVHDAEDAVQETLLAALRSVDRFSGASSVRTWLVGILNHKIADHFRRTARENVGKEDDAATLPVDDFFQTSGHLAETNTDWDADPGVLLERREFARQLQECLRMLPDRLFRVYAMREMNEFAAAEICGAVGITETNLWVMLHRARLQLRRCLERSWFGRSA